jgi:hypothetical protein
MTSAWLFLVPLCASGAALGGDREDAKTPALPEPGPENSGLRLRLVVANPPPGGPAEHDMRLEVLNVGKEPVTLVTEWRLGAVGAGDYAQYLEEATTFTAVPEVLVRVFCVGGGGDPVQVDALIGPGRSFVSEWRVKGRTLSSFVAQRGLTFPADGRFLVRAHVTVKTSAGRYVRLWSNEQPFIVGGRDAAPRQCVARVLPHHGNKGKQNVVLDVGTVGGAKVGDVFRVPAYKRGYWDLHLTHVYRDDSTASVARKSYYEDGRLRLPDLPGRGMEAELRPEKEDPGRRDGGTATGAEE